ncbi:NADH-quinone oxidoreductase subunit L [Aquipuribacter nitratireducens]|uniref:NADH-quinone oxidoreductase subunit L n=1 Tax=Aquipuribacter nitratireducens TaxID=650104 RepID=A0ABW0GNP4_9MICO
MSPVPTQGLTAVPATGAEPLAWLLVVIPLVSAGVLLLAGRSADRWGHWLGVAASTAAFVVGAAVFWSVLGHDAEERARSVAGFSWVPAGTFQVEAGLLVDPLSLSFVLLITFVGTLIHLYSVSYMEHDPGRRRFFAYLNLFVAAMLLLVLADSYLLLYVGWEGVGLASYLLIGFWNHRLEYAVAAKKAFVANRVGDFGLSLAIMAMFVAFGSVSFTDVLGGASGASEGWLTAIGLLLLLAACGKSAQFPLQSWLGDAMAGPTPVSALIHAATMVTAGVYLVVRSGPIYEGAPAATLAVAVVGAITLLFGAIVGSAKDDIKKALAASTMSQIGYMMLAAGLGPIGYVFAIFHLLTHGFFKAGMFLGAGSVMHGMNDETDMRRFGGLRTVMMATWITFGLGWLAIIGVPPFSGFFSKDEIIHAAFEGEGWRPWVLGTVTVIGAGITAFYMSRLFFMTFHGRRRWHDGTDAPAPHPHESPALMVAPMVVLAVGSAGLGPLLYYTHWLEDWLEPVFTAPPEVEPVIDLTIVTAATLLVIVVGVATAWAMYLRQPVPVTAPRGSFATRAARNDLFQDDVNDIAFVEPGQAFVRGMGQLDDDVVSGAVRALARSVSGIGTGLSRLQTGFVRSYALSMFVGVGLVVAALVIVQN